MTPTSISLIFTVLFVMAVLAPNKASGQGTVSGGWQPIKNTKDTKVVGTAIFAVTEHNKKNHTSLSYVNVVSGEMQVVAGKNYKLVIAAMDVSAESKNYNATVSCPLEGHRKLISFVKLG